MIDGTPRTLKEAIQFGLNDYSRLTIEAGTSDANGCILKRVHEFLAHRFQIAKFRSAEIAQGEMDQLYEEVMLNERA